MRRDERLIVLVAAPLQLLVLYMVPLVFECDARTFYEWSAATTYRPPLMTGLLLFTGQYHLDTFLVTVLAHAMFGVLSCLLVYRTLVPLTRWGALVAAMAYVLSLVPFTAAKLMLAEQLFTVAVLWAVYCLSRYWFSEERRYIGLDDRCWARGDVYTMGRAGHSSLLLPDIVCMGLVAWSRADVGDVGHDCGGDVCWVVVLPGSSDGGYAGLWHVTEWDRPTNCFGMCMHPHGRRMGSTIGSRCLTRRFGRNGNKIHQVRLNGT